MAIILVASGACFSCCGQPSVPGTAALHPQEAGTNPYPNIGAIPVPPGYQRVAAAPHSFAGWLRAVALKKDRTVYLYDGSLKNDQQVQFAVLDISTGNKDLQQCADAVMRLRAEFLYSLGDLEHIDFHTVGGLRLNFGEWARGKRFRLTAGRLAEYTAGGGQAVRSGQGEGDGPARGNWCGDRKCFGDYLETVFAYCSTLSLEKQLYPVAHSNDMQIGDVLIRGGSPGHAMLVVDMAEDRTGHKIYMLAQSYMPAQDIHIVKNIYDPMPIALNATPSPWYRLADGPVYTPEWTFSPGQLRSWPE